VPGIPVPSPIAHGIRLQSTTARGPPLALPNPLAPVVSQPHKANHSPGIWAHFAAAWAADRRFAAVAVAWAAAFTVAEWVVVASMGVAVEWVVDTVAVAAVDTGKV
jgi:hypothetical protein